MVAQKLQRLFTRLLGPLALAVLAGAFFMPTAAQAADGRMEIILIDGTNANRPDITASLKNVTVTGQLEGANSSLPSTVTFTLQGSVYVFTNGGAPQSCQSAPYCSYVVTVKDASGNVIGSEPGKPFSAGTQKYSVLVTPPNNKTGNLTGVVKVRDPNENNAERLPICGTKVTATKEGAGGGQVFSYTMPKDPKAVACFTDGKYSLAGLPPGKYTIKVEGTYNGAQVTLPFTYTKTGHDIKAGNNTLNITADGTKKEDAGGAGDVKPMCDAASLTWVICPVISVAQLGIVQMEKMITGLLVSQPLNENNPEGKALKQLWAAVRNIANVAFVVIFFAVIFGTALGIDNYTVKKMLPRLIAAAVLIQFSYLLMGLAVDLSNIAGAGIETLASAVPGASSGNSARLQTLGFVEASGLLAIGTTLLVTTELIVPVLLTVLSALLGILTVWISLQFRHILIDFLVVIAPIAIVLWALPNTKKFSDKWTELFGGLLVIQPIIVGIFVVSNLLSNIIAKANTGTILGNLTASIIPIIACFSVGTVVAKGPGLFAKGAGMISGLSKGPRSGINSLKKTAAENRHERGLQRFAELSRNGKAGSLLGRAARIQAGMGVGFRGMPKINTPQGRRMEAAIDKAATDRANTEALTAFREQNGGVESFQQTVEGRRRAAIDKMFESQIAAASLSEITVETNVNGVVKETKVQMAQASNVDGGMDKLQEIATDQTQSTATRAAAMRAMSITSGGRNRLADLRVASVSSGGFGGNYTDTKVDSSMIDLWQRGVANVKADAAPDLVKGPSGFSGVSAEEFASMDTKTKARYLTVAASSGNAAIIKEANDAMSKVVSDQQLMRKFSGDDWKGIEAVIQRNTSVLVDPRATASPGPAAPATTPTPTTTPATPTAPTTPATPAAPAAPINVTVNVPQRPGIAGSPTAPATWQQTPTGLVIPGSAPAPGTVIHPAVDRLVEEGQDDTQNPRAIN